MAKSIVSKVNDFALGMLKEEENNFLATDYHRLVQNAAKYSKQIKELPKGKWKDKNILRTLASFLIQLV